MVRLVELRFFSCRIAENFSFFQSRNTFSNKKFARSIDFRDKLETSLFFSDFSTEKNEKNPNSNFHFFPIKVCRNFRRSAENRRKRREKSEKTSSELEENKSNICIFLDRIKFYRSNIWSTKRAKWKTPRNKSTKTPNRSESKLNANRRRVQKFELRKRKCRSREWPTWLRTSKHKNELNSSFRRIRLVDRWNCSLSIFTVRRI